MLRREAGLDRASLPIKFINSAHFVAPSQNRSLGLASSRRKIGVSRLWRAQASRPCASAPAPPPPRPKPIAPAALSFPGSRRSIAARGAPSRHPGPASSRAASGPPLLQNWGLPAEGWRGAGGAAGEEPGARPRAGGGGHGGHWNAGEGQEAAGAAGEVDAGACQRSREGEGCGRAAAWDGGFAIWVRTGRWAWRPRCRSGGGVGRGTNDNSARGAHGHHHGADHRTLARGAQA